MGRAHRDVTQVDAEAIDEILVIPVRAVGRGKPARLTKTASRRNSGPISMSPPFTSTAFSPACRSPENMPSFTHTAARLSDESA